MYTLNNLSNHLADDFIKVAHNRVSPSETSNLSRLTSTRPFDNN